MDSLDGSWAREFVDSTWHDLGTNEHGCPVFISEESCYHHSNAYWCITRWRMKLDGHLCFTYQGLHIPEKRSEIHILVDRAVTDRGEVLRKDRWNPMYEMDSATYDVYREVIANAVGFAIYLDQKTFSPVFVNAVLSMSRTGKSNRFNNIPPRDLPPILDSIRELTKVIESL